MPEIPDLDAFSKNLTKNLRGARLETLVAHKRAKATPSVAAIKKLLTGKKLLRVFREGKQLRFEFENKHLLGVHLMLHGEFRWEEHKKPTYVVFTFGFAKKPPLWLTDFHFKANIFLDPEPASSPDVLDKKVNFRFWKKVFGSPKAVKTLLMDQDIVRGMGNAYTDEILYEAGIAPDSIASGVPDNKIRDLMKAIPKVFNNASKEISKNEPDIIGGKYRAFMKVHNSKKDKTQTGYAIKKKSVGGRKSYYTEEQVLYK